MQHLHNLIARLYPGWPASLTGHRVQIHLADEERGWLHIDSDDGGGLDTPVKPRALHHLHISAEWTDANGTPRRPVALLSVFAPTGLVTDELGPLAFTPECMPFLYVPTAWSTDAADAAQMQRVWTRRTTGLVRRRSALRGGIALLRQWDDAIGGQWQP